MTRFYSYKNIIKYEERRVHHLPDIERWKEADMEEGEGWMDRDKHTRCNPTRQDCGAGDVAPPAGARFQACNRQGCAEEEIISY